MSQLIPRIRRWSPLLAAALLAVSMAAQAATPFEYGICVHMGTNNITNKLTKAEVSQLGFNSFRDDVFWHRVEWRKGSPMFPDNLKDLDQYVRESKAIGVRPLIVLSATNKLYDDGDLPLSDEAITGFANYVRFVVRHFKGDVDQYEIYNEWNIGLGSSKKPRTHGTPEAYAKLVQKVAPVIREENPAAQVIVGAVAGLDDKWIDGFFATGALSLADGFSVHPYVVDPLFSNRLPETSINWLDTLHARIVKTLPNRPLPVYVTEVGWPTNEGKMGVPETLVGSYYVRYMLMARTRPWIQGVWWYTLTDLDGSAEDKENRYGLMHKDSSLKPAMEAARSMGDLFKTEATYTQFVPVKGAVGVRVQSALGTSIYAWRSDDKGSMAVATKDLYAAAGVASLPANAPASVNLTSVPTRLFATPKGISAAPSLTQSFPLDANKGP